MARRKSSTAQPKPAAAEQSSVPPAVAPPTTTVAPVTPMIVGGPSGMPQGDSHVASSQSDPSAVSASTLKPDLSPTKSTLEDNQQGDLRSTSKAPMVIMPPRPPAGAPDAIEVDARQPALRGPALPAGTLIDVTGKRPMSGDSAPSDKRQPSASRPMAGTPSVIAPPAASENASTPAPLSPVLPAGAPVNTSAPAVANPDAALLRGAPAAPAGQPVAFQGGNVSTTSGTPPTRGTMIVQPTTPGPAAAPVGGSSSSAQPVPVPPASASASRPASSMPVPSSSSALSNGVSPQTAILADVLRAAAQIVADRDAADAAAQKARDHFVIDDSKIKALRDQLYDELEGLFKAATQVSSPAISAYALDTLKKARTLIVAGVTPDDLAQAELLIERVRTKLNRSDTLVPEGELPHIVGIIVWTLAVFVLSLPLAVSFLYAGDKFQVVNLVFGREAIPFLAAFGWGTIGGVIGVIYNMTWFVQMRDYDPAYNLDYIMRPIKGFIVGGILMLIFAFGGGSMGLVSAGGSQTNPLAFGLVYLMAVLGGFKQEVIFDWFDAVLKAALRTTTAKAESEANVQAATPTTK